MKKIIVSLTVLIVLLSLSACSGSEFNLFSIEDDIAFGQQLDEEILANPEEYPLLDPATNQAVYNYVEGIMEMILESDDVRYRDEFPWQVRIIDQDVLNAFAAPGGYLYFYTGFLNFAESEAELAGVMAHEIAHADRRHSTETMTDTYGIQVLLSLLLGNEPSLMSDILSALTVGSASLKFSRDHEYEADSYALNYLYSIKGTRAYYLPAMKDFFNRIEEMYNQEGEGSAFELMFRTHPYNDDREMAMDELYRNLGEPEGNYYRAEHIAIKALLQ